MQKIAEKINRSQRLEKLLSFVSSYLANYRGMPILSSIVLITLSLLINIIAILIDIKWVFILGTLTLHIALLLGLIGLLLAEPLGKG